MNHRKSLARAFIMFMALPLTFMSCDVFGGLANPEDSGAAFVRFMEPVGGTIDLSLYATNPDRNAYVVFTTGYDDDLVPPVATSSSASRSATTITTDRNRGVQEKASEARREDLRKLLASYQPPAATRRSIAGGDPAGDVKDSSQGPFKVYIDNSGVPMIASVDATCRFFSGPIGFGENERSLSIWVANDCWSPLLIKKHYVTQDMVNALAASFFGTAASRDSSIYAAVTNMLGAEWGAASSFTNYGTVIPTIGETDNVTILLADIYEQNADGGGVVGYFSYGNIIPDQVYSNERVMFAIDAIMFANPDDEGQAIGQAGYSDNGWQVTDYWTKEIFSTLAHEFQHMIHFYQKGVVAGADLAYEPTWIDELCSMQVEDLLADKMGVPGPRGVDPDDGAAGPPGNISGRLSDYVLWPDLSPLGWDSAGGDMILSYYSWAYSFGAYLTRNYGGAEFVRNVVQSPYADERSVMSAAMAATGRAESMDSLLRRWGAAVLLSSRTDAPEYYRYNTGQFFSSTVGGTLYRLGSIDLRNYVYPDGIDTDGDEIGDADQYGPYVYSALSIDQLYGGAYSNAFMDLGDPFGKPDWKITVPEGMYATIVID